MKSDQEPNQLSAVEAVKKIHAGTLTSLELVKSCLSRIEKRESDVAAWQYLSSSQALEAAKKSDENASRGELQGIPIGIKDIFDTADMPTENGSSIYKGNMPSADASCVSRIKNEDGVILGKTVTTEFAYFQPGKTANPHNLKHTPGGSSSGSAAAVADFMVPLALGSQTVGSTIRPASFCGIVGYKPSFGFIDRTGVRTLAETFDTIGIFARTVGDAAHLGSVISRRPSLKIDQEGNQSLKFGICNTSEWHSTDEDTRAAFNKATTLIDRAGGEIQEIVLPDIFESLADAQALITDFEAANSAAHELRANKALVSQRYCEKAEAGLSYSEQEYDAALSVILQAQASYKKVIHGLDAILCPSATGEAPKGHEFTGDPILNRMGTALQIPCVNIPGLTGRSGLPVGVQLIGQFKADAKVLNKADWLHKVLLKA